jgi:3'-5' exonuclease
MIDTLNPRNILFLDIETVPQFNNHCELPDHFKKLWEKKCLSFVKEPDTAETVYSRAGIYAEFGKIVCISVGAFTADETFRIKSFFNHDEKQLLQEFSHMLNTSFASGDKILCAHNGKEFDFPFICRRILINGLKLPAILEIRGKKPWEIMHLDTMELWKFGDYKSYTSLNLLAAVFGIPTPKDDIDGSMVWEVYWKQNDLERIVTYCQKDVITIAQLFRKYRCEPLLQEDEIFLPSEKHTSAV